MEDGLSYKDIEEHEKLFSLVPPFLLERFAKKNTNLVLKFKSKIQAHMDNMNDVQKSKLDLILRTDIGQLQDLMRQAYMKTNNKQYKILSNPDYRQFIETNLNELIKMR